MADNQKSGRIATALIVIGISQISMGAPISLLATSSHNLVTHMFIRGASVFVMIIGLIIAVVGIKMAQKAKETSGK